ncbi:hypothetical protein SV7mr_24130 [Stieleria bergensis]|uniref:Uncharacterized protein n=1 Tax=Stieleria bergensis TaxID=2528025 RepID=A0A517SUX2_9BACT|nr:hypothetical protein SV7mr_24130 [Planctomycetes bacterium SV_7m_r]
MRPDTHFETETDLHSPSVAKHRRKRVSNPCPKPSPLPTELDQRTDFVAWADTPRQANPCALPLSSNRTDHRSIHHQKLAGQGVWQADRRPTQVRPRRST